MSNIQQSISTLKNARSKTKILSKIVPSSNPLLWCAYFNRGTSGDHEPRVQRIGERGLNSVKEHHLTRIRDAVEGQAPGLVVQIHSYSTGAGHRYPGFDFIVPEGATGSWEGNAPGLICVSKATLLQLWPFVAHSDLNPGPLPLDLPVAHAS